MSSIQYDIPQTLVVNLDSIDEFKFILGDEEVVFTSRQMLMVFQALKLESEKLERDWINV